MEGRPQRTAVVHDPHPLWLDAVRDVLARVRLDVLATTTREQEVRALVLEHQPDLVVTTSLAVLGHTRAPRAIVVADEADSVEMDAAFAAGAAAYVLKTAHPDDLATAVRQAFEQTLYTVSRAVAPPPPPVEPGVLTRREHEILCFVAEGRSNAEVAALLWVTRQTVKFHLASVYRKLAVTNRTEAARWAHDNGLLTRPTRALAA